MQEIQLIARFAIQAGKTDAFKEIASQMVEAVKANEPGALQYDWHYSADQSVCKVLERYGGVGAVRAHVQNVGPLLGRILEISTISGEVYGPITEDLKKIFEGLEVSYFEFDMGL